MKKITALTILTTLNGVAFATAKVLVAGGFTQVSQAKLAGGQTLTLKKSANDLPEGFAREIVAVNEVQVSDSGLPQGQWRVKPGDLPLIGFALTSVEKATPNNVTVQLPTLPRLGELTADYQFRV